MARIQYNPSARRRGFQPEKLSTQGVARIREDTNRVLRGMEQYRQGVNEQYARELTAMKEDAAYAASARAQNQKTALYNLAQEGKQQIGSIQTQLQRSQQTSQAIEGLLQFSQTASKLITQEANRQTERNVAAALAEPISIEEDLSNLAAQRAQMDGGLELMTVINEDAVLTNEDPVQTIKNHTSNPMIVGKARQVYDNRRAVAIADALYDEYTLSPDKNFTALDGTEYSGLEAQSDATLARQLAQKIKEDVFIAMGNPNPAYLQEALKQIDNRNSTFQRSARAAEAERLLELGKDQIDSLYSNNNYEDAIAAYKLSESLFGRAWALDRLTDQIKDIDSDSAVLLSLKLEGPDKPAFGEKHYNNRVRAALREKEDSIVKRNDQIKRSKQQQFDNSIVNNYEQIYNEMRADPDLFESKMKRLTSQQGLSYPNILTQMKSSVIEANEAGMSANLDDLFQRRMLDESFVNSIKNVTLNKRAKELLEQQNILDYGVNYPALIEGIDDAAKKNAGFESTIPGETSIKVEQNKIAMLQWAKENLKITKDADITAQNLQNLLADAVVAPGTDPKDIKNPFAYFQTAAGNEFVFIGKPSQAEKEQSDYFSRTVQDKNLGQIVSIPNFLMSQKQQEKVMAYAERGLPFAYPDNIDRLYSLFEGKYSRSEIFNAAAEANNLHNMTNIPLLEESMFTSMLDNAPSSVVKLLKSSLENGSPIQGQRALIGFTNRQPPLRASMGGSSFNPDAVPGGYGGVIQQAATENGIPPEILAGLIDTESSFNPGAVSPVGAQGLGQFMPETAAEFGVNVNDPVSSIDGAARYLRYLVDYFNGDMNLAISAYNGGMGNIERYGGPIPGNKENEEYLPKVLNNANKYK